MNHLIIIILIKALSAFQLYATTTPAAATITTNKNNSNQQQLLVINNYNKFILISIQRWPT